MGKHLIYSLLAAFSVARILRIDFSKIVTALSNFKPLAGRGRILKGKNNNLIIDESYNASPLSVQVALDFLRDFKTNKKKIAILGDMKELGEQSLESHQALAEQARFADVIILVGSEIIAAYNFLKKQHPKVYYFEDVDSLGQKLGHLIESDNLILIKGSQAVRLEKIVEKLISSHYNKEATLVRQSKEWKDKNN